MELLWTALLGVIALGWIVMAIRAARGIGRLPRLECVAPLADADCPSLSILLSARDEAVKMPQALPTLLAQDYPDYEVVAVDDRSSDATAQILDDFAGRHSNLKVVHLKELPPGWLGKPHGLYTAWQHARGDWLVFTDADVRFSPDLLRRAVAVVRRQGWDHVTLAGLVEAHGFWEKVAVSYFALGFVLYHEPWNVSDPRSKKYFGVGSFQMVRRSAYEAAGTHQRLKMEVIDDVKLGKIIKQAGFRSGVALPKERVRLRWQEGLSNIIRGTTKNFFAATGFSLPVAAAQVLAILLANILPFLALLLLPGLPGLLAALTVLVLLLMHALIAHDLHISPLYAFTHPLGAAIFAYMILRSTVVTLWRGGVVWRDTFYSIEDLKKGVV
ncbi:MAG TPA: glycosyltransferase family 2 protein [Candidatus Acidoferrales bacterium]|nr:glycosyltransferase family 2 protein [Candidatus Acidoferrales bacterium]